MLKLSKTALAACASLAVAIPAATAADLTVDAPELPVQVPTVPEAVSGWYLRGDIGYKVYDEPSAEFDDPVIGFVPFNNAEIDDTGLIGAGIGYKFNDFFRADVTLDYEFPAQFYGETPCQTCTTLPNFSREYADISALTTMVNAYVDLGRFSGVSPYVGAGIGSSYIMTDNINYILPDGSRGTFEGDGKWSLSWAVMAGVGLEFSPNLALDVGYRYLNLGSGHSAVLPIGSGASRIEYEDLEAHELRVGMRYTIF